MKTLSHKETRALLHEEIDRICDAAKDHDVSVDVETKNDLMEGPFGLMFSGARTLTLKVRWWEPPK